MGGWAWVALEGLAGRLTVVCWRLCQRTPTTATTANAASLNHTLLSRVQLCQGARGPAQS